MSRHFLGETLDIHGGGPDLVFPHHENEIAQSEGASGKTFARYWMHSGPLRVRSASGVEEKMSKSLGNFWTVRDALKETNERYGLGNGNEVLRFFLLRSHYRSPISFNPALIEEAHKGLLRFYSALKGRELEPVSIDWNDPWCARFKAAMDDDFNTPEAVSVLFDLAAEVNRTADVRLAGLLKSLGGILNVLQIEPEHFLKGATQDLDAAAIDALVAERVAAKKARDWARADEIRNALKQQGIIVEDGPQGSSWRRA